LTTGHPIVIRPMAGAEATACEEILRFLYPTGSGSNPARSIPSSPVQPTTTTSSSRRQVCKAKKLTPTKSSPTNTTAASAPIPPPQSTAAAPSPTAPTTPDRAAPGSGSWDFSAPGADGPRKPPARATKPSSRNEPIDPPPKKPRPKATRARKPLRTTSAHRATRPHSPPELHPYHRLDIGHRQGIRMPGL